MQFSLKLNPQSKLYSIVFVHRCIKPGVANLIHLVQNIEGLSPLKRSKNMALKLIIHPDKYFVKHVFENNWHAILASAPHVGRPFIITILN